ncbi:hypothetical protein TRFO_24714 [Tritrichomonas foetus]|uniref:Uncharacterized protein n=1 Tax=Tritrichomonas foetus TaxID=1144522 RepID=A0A1J4KBJ9_9EUKA|nr:hypothetical protein TRFO_24714 [Tritrichomonas foetus]|eukprot:OHT07062.1 hypothetical protein TRFO_24714 [Tritrichomonas foetus]
MAEEVPEQVAAPAEEPAPVQAEEPAPAPAAEPAPVEDDVPMGACPLLKFKPNDFLRPLQAYEQYVFNLEGMLFWRRPIPMVILLVLVESFFIFVKCSNLSTFAVVFLLIALRYLAEIVYKQFGATLGPILFPPIDEGKPEETNRIYPLLPMCQRGSYLCSVIYNKIKEIKAALSQPTTKTTLYAAGVASAGFLFFWVVGTFWFNFVLVNLVLLAPGIVMHPQVFPYCEPYILKFAGSIGCPYCKPKFD